MAFNAIQKCDEPMVYSITATKTTDNRVKAVKSESDTVDFRGKTRINITKFKRNYTFVLDGVINWLVVSENGVERIVRSYNEFLDFTPNANECYQTVKIHPYLYQVDPNLFVELKVENNVDIIPRASWGAREPSNDPRLSYDSVNPSTYDSIAIHHTGNWHNYPTMSMAQDEQMDAQNIKDRRADIGYHFGIDKDGKIYEGRDINVLGSHIANGNTGRIGVVFLADLSTDDAGLNPVERLGAWTDGSLTPQMEKSMLKLCVHLDHQYGIETLGGHKEFSAVLGSGDRYCPGNLAMAKMNGWRRILNKQAP